MLDDFVQGTLRFAPTTTPIGEGAAALDKELGKEGRGKRRAILEVLLDCDCSDEESALTGTCVHEALNADGAYDEDFARRGEWSRE